MIRPRAFQSFSDRVPCLRLEAIGAEHQAQRIGYQLVVVYYQNTSLHV